jgi:hypothetical protein
MLLDFFESWNSKSRMGKFEVLVISYIFAICMELSIFSKKFFWNEYQNFLSIDIITIHCLAMQCLLFFHLNLTLLHFIFALKRLKTQKSKIAPVSRHVHGLLELLGQRSISNAPERTAFILTSLEHSMSSIS